VGTTTNVSHRCTFGLTAIHNIAIIGYIRCIGRQSMVIRSEYTD